MTIFTPRIAMSVSLARSEINTLLRVIKIVFFLSYVRVVLAKMYANDQP